MLRPCQFDARHDELVSNLLNVYKRATDADVLSGRAWYPHARRIVREWAKAYRAPVRTVACVIAALSPQVEWSRNLIMADDVLAGRALSIRGLQSNEQKARRILNGHIEDIRTVFPHGPKVFNFSRNLAGSLVNVTVDTHAMQAALDDVRATYTLRWRPYNVFASAYRTAAREVNVWPDAFQAIIWHTWKRENPRAEKLKARTRWVSIGMED